MNAVKFLTESIDTPRNADIKDMKLPVPSPGLNEFRKYFNHRNEIEKSFDEESGEMEEREIPAADFVSVVADHEPTIEEWTEVLRSNGYDDERIALIINAEAE